MGITHQDGALQEMLALQLHEYSVDYGPQDVDDYKATADLEEELGHAAD